MPCKQSLYAKPKYGSDLLITELSEDWQLGLELSSVWTWLCELFKYLYIVNTEEIPEEFYS